MLHRNSDLGSNGTAYGIVAAALAAAMLLVPVGGAQAKSKDKDERSAMVYPAAPEPAYRTPGAIFSTGSYQPLIGGDRAARVGDILTIVLVENMTASKSASTKTGKNSNFGFALPATGWFSLFAPSDTEFSSGSDFDGKGTAAQSNNLFGELTVVVTEVYPNGVMRVAGQKAITLNRGDEFVEVTGLVRRSDVSADNRVPSTRVADADIKYYGKGEIAEASKKGWLGRFFSWINPF